MAKEFGNLKQDASNKPIQVGATIETSDATSTPVTSPIATVGDASATVLTVPTNATNVVIRPAGDLRVSEASDLSTIYYTVPSGATHSFPVAGADFIYIQSDSGNIAVNFYFITV